MLVLNQFLGKYLIMLNHSNALFVNRTKSNICVGA